MYFNPPLNYDTKKTTVHTCFYKLEFFPGYFSPSQAFICPQKLPKNYLMYVSHISYVYKPSLVHKSNQNITNLC